MSLKLLYNIKPYHCQRPIRIPRIHIDTLKKEINRLIEIGVLEKVYEGEAGPWCAASWIIPKKGGQVRLITDFREVNKSIKRKPWPMPHIMDLIQDIGHYDYVTAIDLSMAFYHFELTPSSSDMATFMLPFGLFKYRRMAMGLSISPDILQGHMSRLFHDLSHIKVYMDDLLVFTRGSYDEHLRQVDQALQRLGKKNLAVNAMKSFWGVDDVDLITDFAPVIVRHRFLQIPVTISGISFFGNLIDRKSRLVRHAPPFTNVPFLQHHVYSRQSRANCEYFWTYWLQDNEEI